MRKRRKIIHRRKSINKLLDRYVTLDFEKMTPEAHTVCSVGVVVVEYGRITHRFYCLIKPITNEVNEYAQAAHGLELCYTKYAPSFREVWEMIDKIIGNSPIVGHHVCIERKCIQSLNDLYGTNYDYKFIDTQVQSKEMGYKRKYNLEVVTEGIGYNLEHHHNPLDDALACRSILETAINKKIKVKPWREHIDD